MGGIPQNTNRKEVYIMASAKPTLNPLTDTPTSKTQITKPFMLAYMKSEKATPEDRAWFKAIVADPDYRREQINQLTGKPYIDIDIPKVRKAFVERFYPNLAVKKKGKKTFIEEIENLF